MPRYLWLITLLSLPACVAVGPNHRVPSVQGVQDTFVYSDREVYTSEGKRDANPWWTAYSDPKIGEAVEIALTNNRDLQSAYYRLEASQARLGAARSGLLPQGGTGFTITRQEAAQAAFAGFAGGGAGGGGSAENPEFTTYQPVAQASWEIDLFGRLRRQVEGAKARADEQEALYRDTQRLIAARTVDAYILLVEAMNRRQVARENLALQQQTLDLIKELVEVGASPEFDYLRQETQVNSTAAQLKLVENSAAEATAALSLLLGLTVPEFLDAFPGLVGEEVVPTIPTADSVVVLSDPAEVLRKRPDVRSAERALAAETADIGVATAGLFPSITLDGNASLTALSFDGLSDSQAFGYSAGPSISWQILSYPRLLQERAAAKAEAAAALAQYEAAVLGALTETDQVLAVYTGAVEQAELLAAAERAALKSLALSEARFTEGEDSLLTLLDAQRVALSTQDQSVQAKASALRARAAVHRVLAD